MADASMADSSTAPHDGERSLYEDLVPSLLSPKELKQQVALYIETAALKPLLCSGVAFDQIAETFIELAVRGVQQRRGRLAAAVMLQRATRQAFSSADQGTFP